MKNSLQMLAALVIIAIVFFSMFHYGQMQSTYERQEMIITAVDNLDMIIFDPKAEFYVSHHSKYRLPLDSIQTLDTLFIIFTNGLFENPISPRYRLKIAKK